MAARRPWKRTSEVALKTLQVSASVAASLASAGFLGYVVYTAAMSFMSPDAFAIALVAIFLAGIAAIVSGEGSRTRKVLRALINLTGLSISLAFGLAVVGGVGAILLSLIVVAVLVPLRAFQWLVSVF